MGEHVGGFKGQARGGTHLATRRPGACKRRHATGYSGLPAPGIPMATSRVLLCHCACPNVDTARRLADTLVGEHLAACANVMPGVQSAYRWQGAVQHATEALLLIKTTTAAFDALKLRLLELHPYELPELVATAVVDGHAAYLDWVRANVADTGRTPDKPS